MPVIYVNLVVDAGSAQLPGANNVVGAQIGAGVLVADLLDENEISTGITLSEGS